MIKRKKDGYVDVFLATMVAIFFLLVIALLCIEPVKELGIYAQLENIERGALYRCEAAGGLTDGTKQMILAQVQSHGLDPNQVTVSCNMAAPDNPPDDYWPVTTYGSEIDLTITYRYVYSTMSIQGFLLGKGDNKSDTITVSASTTAKS